MVVSTECSGVQQPILLMINVCVLLVCFCLFLCFVENITVAAVCDCVCNSVIITMIMLIWYK